MEKKEYRISSLSLVVTKKCNLRCEMCTRDAKTDNQETMSVGFIERIIDQALLFDSLQRINITGGEAFLHPHLEEIINNITRNGLEIRINTNGLFFTDSNIKMLNKYNVKLFTISLDSAVAEVHDKIRGVDGCYEKTVENLKRIKQEGYCFFVKATANENNVDTLFDLMKMVEKIGAYGFSIGRTIPVGRASSNRHINWDFWRKYSEIGRKCSEYAMHSNMKFLIDDPLRHFFDERIKRILEANPTVDISMIRSGCTAGNNFLYILPNGDVLACPALTKAVGNVYCNTLKDIWLHSEVLNTIRDRDRLKGTCGHCSYKYACGGCRAYGYAISGDVLATDSLCPRAIL